MGHRLTYFINELNDPLKVKHLFTQVPTPKNANWIWVQQEFLSLIFILDCAYTEFGEHLVLLQSALKHHVLIDLDFGTRFLILFEFLQIDIRLLQFFHIDRLKDPLRKKNLILW